MKDIRIFVASSKELVAERTRRLKTHEILFAADGAPDSDAARLRVSLPEGAYGVWSGADELRARFLALVDRVAAMDGLVDAKEDGLRTVSAFLAADDAADNPAKFEEDVAETLHDMGVLKVGMADIASARECLAEALEIRTRLAAQAPEKFQKALDETKAELARLEEPL